MTDLCCGPSYSVSAPQLAVALDSHAAAVADETLAQLP